MGLSRRGLLLTAAGLAGASTGCAGAGDSSSHPPETDVVAGPEGRLEFEPETISVTAGGVVTWFFASPGHNVSARPADATAIELPEGARPFATYGPSESPLSLIESGTTFEHRFDVPGTYVYACVPHLAQGMVGTVQVEA